MRELEFLPAWYPQLRRRRRMVLLQSWLVGVVVAGLALWGMLVSNNLSSARAELDGLDRQLSRTDEQLHELDEMLELQKQWRQQAQIFSSLGAHVEASRMLATIESLMPPEMSLLELTMDAERELRAASSLAGVQAAQAKQQASADRRLRVKMKGVAPSDVDVANFLARLGRVPFLENVSMSSSRERIEGGRLMREFELVFAVDLNTPVGG